MSSSSVSPKKRGVLEDGLSKMQKTDGVHVWRDDE